MKDNKTDISTEATTVVAMQQHYSGPLPPAQEFKAYGDVLPSAPERILAMAEKEQGHRHRKETFALYVRTASNILGMVLGMAIVMACLFLAYRLGMSGHDWLAGVVIAIATSCATIFVLRKTPKKD